MRRNVIDLCLSKMRSKIQAQTTYITRNREARSHRGYDRDVSPYTILAHMHKENVSEFNQEYFVIFR